MIIIFLFDIYVEGGTGYIGKYVVKEAVQKGYETIVVVRPESKPRNDFFQGANIVLADVCNEDELRSVIPGPVDAVVSCLASRSGVKDDSYKVDYQATLNSLNAAKALGASNFVLLSAFCVRKPLLQFQYAKLKVFTLSQLASRRAKNILCVMLASLDFLINFEYFSLLSEV